MSDTDFGKVPDAEPSWDAAMAALRAENERLREALIVARENVVHWAGYANDYFKDKHDYVGDLAAIDAALEAKP